MKYRAEIDGLRALAVVPVILFHAGWAPAAGGFVGVDIFFVISGYLITTLIHAEVRDGSFSLARFYERRARRILPALFCVCLACIPFAWLWMGPLQYRDFSQSLIAVGLFCSNLLFWQEAGYFTAASELKPLLHTWSLGVEEQFYLLFPLLLLLLRRRTAKTLGLVLGAVCLASLLLSVYSAEAAPAAAFYLIPARTWELGTGALLALLPATRCSMRLAGWASLGGLVLIAIAIATFDKGTPFPSFYALLPVLGTALLIRYGGAAHPVGELLRQPLLVNIGLVSYSLYLWHQPIFAFVRLRSLHEPTALDMTAAIALAAVLAALTWRFVEAPFRRRERVSVRTIAIGAVAGSALLLVGGVAGHMTNGFANATPARATALRMEHRLDFNRGLDPACAVGFQLLPKCRTSEEPELAVWGDSYAMQLLPGLLASSATPRLIQFTTSLCGPIPGVAPMNAAYRQEWAEGCIDFNARVLDWITSHPSIKYVVLASPFDQYFAPGWRSYTRAGGEQPADWRAVARELTATLDLLEQHGIKPMLVAPPPSHGGDIGRCLLKLQLLQSTGSCDFSEAHYRSKRAGRIEFVRALGGQQRVLWLDRFMCAQGNCATQWDGVPLYQDAGHLSQEGSAALGRRIHFYERATGRFDD